MDNFGWGKYHIYMNENLTSLVCPQRFFFAYDPTPLSHVLARLFLAYRLTILPSFQS